MKYRVRSAAVVFLVVGLSWCLPNTVTSSVIVLANRTNDKVQYRLATDQDPPASYEILPGAAVPFSCRDGVTIELSAGDQRQRYHLKPNEVHFLVGESPHIVLQRVGLPGQLQEQNQSDKRTGQDDASAVRSDADNSPTVDRRATPHGTAVVSVKLLVDENEPTTRTFWEPRLRRLVALASEVLERHSGISFQVVQVETWESDDAIVDLDEAVLDFERKVDPSPAMLAIGFSRQHAMPPADFARVGGIRAPLHTHLLIPTASGSVPRSVRVEMLVHELGHYLGATHSPEPESAMRVRLDQRAVGLGTGGGIRLDPINTLAICLVGEQLRTRGPTPLVSLPNQTRRTLRHAYAAIAEALPEDPEATVEAHVNLLVEPSPVARTRSPLSPVVWQRAYDVAEALQQAVQTNDAPAQADQLTEFYMRVAAQAVDDLPRDQGLAALHLGLGIALDQSGTLLASPFSRFACHAVLPELDGQSRRIALGQPTMHGRREASDAFFATLAREQLGGAQLAYREGLRQELRETRQDGSFSFADFAARESAMAWARQLRKSSLTLRELATDFRVADYVPAGDGLPPDINWQQFLSTYSTPSSQRFNQQRQSIQRQIDELAAQRGLPRPAAESEANPESVDGAQAQQAGSDSPSSTPPSPASDPSTETSSNAEPRELQVSDMATLRRTLARAQPGTRIRLAPGQYTGVLTVSKVTGTGDLPITVQAADPQNPPRLVASAIQLQGCSHVVLRDLLLTGGTRTVIEITDGGGRGGKSHHVTLANLEVRDQGDPALAGAALRMAGVDDFAIRDCRFQRWGRLAIELVGCHRGEVTNCSFTDSGNPNGYAVQTAGGASQIVFRRCTFRDYGLRGVNLGGSTSADAFRPWGANYEVRDITVEGCTFSGGDAPIAFVGVDRAAVRYNTIVRPKRWVLRILQENSAAAFVPCRHGVFQRNLIVYRNSDIENVINVGPKTQPETFLFAENLWHCEDWTNHRPRLPTAERHGTYDVDPQLEKGNGSTFRPRNELALSFGATGLSMDRETEAPYILEVPDLSGVSTDSRMYIRSRMSRTVIAGVLLLLATIALLFAPWKVVAVLVWTYLLGLVAVWIVLGFGDRWWLATAILYGPKFLCAIPLPLLGLAAALKCRRHLWVLLGALAFVLFPIMGTCLPWSRLTTHTPPSLRVVSFNTQITAVHSVELWKMIDNIRPDVVALQEWSQSDGQPWPDGWNVFRHGGLLIASRFPISEGSSFPTPGAEQPWKGTNALRVVLETPHGKTNLFTVHLRTARYGLEQLYDGARLFRFAPFGITALNAEIQRRHLEASQVRSWINSFDGPAVIVGDFNMPVRSAIYRLYWSDWKNAFSTAGLGRGYTKQTPIMALDTVEYGVRIDHILVGEPIQVNRCWIGPDIGSDHRPICADLGW